MATGPRPKKPRKPRKPWVPRTPRGEVIYEHLDPYQFYLKGATIREADAEGLEWLAYKIFGKENIASATFAVDPLSPLRAYRPAQVANRLRKFPGYCLAGPRSMNWVRYTESGVSQVDTSTPYAFDRLPYTVTTTKSAQSVVNLGPQLRPQGWIHDTTRRTRDPEFVDGEFYLWKPRLSSTPRSRRWRDQDYHTYSYTDGNVDHNSSASIRHQWMVGPSGRMELSVIDALRVSEKTLLEQKMADKTLKMFYASLPSKKEFGLAYSIAELKDLPNSIRGTLGTFLGINPRFLNGKLSLIEKEKYLGNLPKDLASEYVNLQFGWESLRRDVENLLSLPENITRQVNFLMKRNGQATTFRLTRKLPPESLSSPPTFSYQVLPDETQESLRHEAMRVTILRLVANVQIEFPRIASYKLREDLTRKLVGIDPTPEDMYNLIPWSWLVDWFTGLGDYVEAFNAINLDPQIINTAWITGVSTVSSQSTFVGKVLKQSVTKIMPGDLLKPNLVEHEWQTHQSRATFTTQIRRSVTNAYGVKPAWDLGSLSDFQASILGALFFMATSGSLANSGHGSH